MEPYTIEQYNGLCASIAIGATMVVYGNKTVTYRNLEDMLRIKSLMEVALGLTPNVPNNGRKYASSSKGLI